MSELTKEFFEGALKGLATKEDLKPLATQESIDELARMVQEGFEGERKYMEGRFSEIVSLLDVRDRVKTLRRRVSTSM